MSTDESSGASPLPVATVIEKPAPRRPGSQAGKSGIVLDPRVLFVGGGVALIGIVVFGIFLWMVPKAAAREQEAACRGLRAEAVLNPALCPGGTPCSTPVAAPDFTAKDIL